MNLGQNVLISSAITPAAGVAGTTDINGTTLDMKNYEGVLMVARMGVITATAVTSIKAQQGDESDLSDAADLLGTGITIAADDDNEIFVIDLGKPSKRYVRLVCDRGTANAVIDATYIQYTGKKAPVTQGSGVTLETHVSPAEGTA